MHGVVAEVSMELWSQKDMRRTDDADLYFLPIDLLRNCSCF